MLELRGACLDLGTMPYAFEMTDQTSLPDFRRRPFAPYLIFYKVEGSQVLVIRIIHGAREYMRMLTQK
ncbi:ParE-like toxin of type II ParDE toxin-antitoxin system [Neorhizobium sp. JUb45]|nr:ParE-like toxin of type II ParDE toxin-antitoxin system [Neorhizobium sp. JUb45]